YVTETRTDFGPAGAEGVGAGVFAAAVVAASAGWSLFFKASCSRLRFSRARASRSRRAASAAALASALSAEAASDDSLAASFDAASFVAAGGGAESAGCDATTAAGADSTLPERFMKGTAATATASTTAAATPISTHFFFDPLRPALSTIIENGASAELSRDGLSTATLSSDAFSSE